MPDFLTFSDRDLILIAIIGTGLWLALRAFTGMRLTLGLGGIGRGKRTPLDQKQITLLLADVRALIDRLQVMATQARQPVTQINLAQLDFDIPHRLAGDLDKLDRSPPPIGPTLAVAARKALALRHRLHDANWLAAQRAEGTDPSVVHGRLADEADSALGLLRRAEILLRKSGPNRPRLRLVKR